MLVCIVIKCYNHKNINNYVGTMSYSTYTSERKNKNSVTITFA